MRQCFYIDRQSESRAGGTGGACFKTAAGVRIEFRDECAGHPELHFQNFEVGICLGSRQEQPEEKRNASFARGEAD